MALIREVIADSAPFQGCHMVLWGSVDEEFVFPDAILSFLSRVRLVLGIWPRLRENELLRGHRYDLIRSCWLQ